MCKSIFVVCLLAVCTFAFASSALAIDGMYVSGNVGAVILNHSDTTVGDLGSGRIGYDTGYAITAAVGRKVEYVRLEGELSYSASDMEGGSVSYSDDTITASGSAGGDVQTLSFMLNTYFDIDTGTSLTPFIGGGIGVAKIDAKIWGRGTKEEGGVVSSISESTSDDDVVFAYQGIVGVAYAINANTSLDLSYRYFATSDPDFKGDIDSEYGGNHLMLGFRYSF